MTFTIKAKSGSSRKTGKRSTDVKSPSSAAPRRRKAKSYKSSKSVTAWSSPAAYSSKIVEGTPYPRTLVDWLKKDDALLVKSVAAGADLFDTATALEREPMTVIGRLNVTGLFEFEPQSEEHLEIMSWLLSGVPLGEAIRWCAGDSKRLTWGALDALRRHDDPRAAIDVAWRHGLWRLTVADLTDLRWLAAQDQAAVAKSVATVLEAFEAPTAATVRAQVAGGAIRVAPPSFWTALKAAGEQVACAPAAPARKKRSGSSGSSRWSGKARRTKSASVSAGAPFRDTRTAAERAWENLDHW